MKNAAVLSLIALSVAGCEPNGSLSYAVPINTPRKLDAWADLNEDCSSRGETVLRVTAPPSHGKVEFKHGKDYPYFEKDNVRVVCNKKLVESTLIWYRPDVGYAGSDSLSISVLFPSGGTRDMTYSISVK